MPIPVDKHHVENAKKLVKDIYDGFNAKTRRLNNIVRSIVVMSNDDYQKLLYDIKYNNGVIDFTNT